MHAYGKLYAFGKPAKASFTLTPVGISVKELLSVSFGNRPCTTFQRERTSSSHKREKLPIFMVLREQLGSILCTKNREPAYASVFRRCRLGDTVAFVRT